MIQLALIISAMFAEVFRRWRRLRRQIRKPFIVLMCLAIIIWMLAINKYIGDAYLQLRYGSELNTSEPLKYLVDTPGCKIAEIDPFGPDFQAPFRVSQCQPAAIIPVGEKLKYLEAHDLYEHANCCYSEIHRKSQPAHDYNLLADKSVTYSRPCKPIPKPHGVDFPSEFVRIICEFDKRSPEAMYYYAKPLPLSVHSKDTAAKEQYWENMGPKIRTENGNIPSVFIIGISSISRNGMIRSLPHTRKFLLDNDFIELKGFTAVPMMDNRGILLNFLSGARIDQPYVESCFKNDLKMDDCPILWTNFSNRKYVTGFVEDAAESIPWSNDRVGFVQQPTDYYYRPFSQAYSSMPGSRYYLRTCFGGYTETELMINYTLGLLHQMRKVPYFLLSWHLSSIMPASAWGLKSQDDRFMRYMEQVVQDTKGHLHEPVIIFVSDTGLTKGYIRATFQGFYEETLPMAFIRFPQSLKKSKPSWYQALKINSNRLTTAFDIHATLENLLNMELTVRDSDKDSIESTLFQEIPPDRTCSDARILDAFCRCGVVPGLREDLELVKNLSLILTMSVNQHVESEIRKNMCIPFNEPDFFSHQLIRQGMLVLDSDTGLEMGYKDYRVSIVKMIGDISYEAVFRVMDNSSIYLSSPITTSAGHANLGMCLTDETLKQYCFCRDNLVHNYWE